MMSGHPGAAGRAGGVGRGGLEKKAVIKPKPAKKAAGYALDMEAIKNDIFYCGKPEHAVSFERSLKRVTDYIR